MPQNIIIPPLIMGLPMNVMPFKLKKPGSPKVHTLKLVNDKFYILKSGKWVIKSFYKEPTGYHRSTFSFEKYTQTSLYYHRLVYYAHFQSWNIWDSGPDNKCDHHEHTRDIPLDNHISNLRILTAQENTFNTNAKGYSYCRKTGKWRARIRLNHKVKELGYFITEEDAHQAYLDAKAIYHVITPQIYT
jgi:hypothetical protein